MVPNKEILWKCSTVFQNLSTDELFYGVCVYLMLQKNKYFKIRQYIEIE